MKPGLMLFAHGARDPRWAEPFAAVAKRVRAGAPGTEVELAFLEFMSPTLDEAGSRLAAKGCTRVEVLPLFLGSGGHVRKDLPVMLDALAAAHPAVEWRLHPAVGELESVTDAMAQAALNLLAPPDAHP